MKGMKSAQENQYVVPPAGTYRTRVVAATDKVSRSGNTMLEIEVEIQEPAQFAGFSVRDWIGTDGSTGFGRVGKKKLRGIGVDVDSSDEEVPDSVIAGQILGREVWTTFKQEQRTEESTKGSGQYDKPVFDFVNGQQVPRMQLRVDGYGGVLNRAPAAPVQAQAPAPQAYPQQAQAQQFNQQFAPQAAPQYAPAPQQFVPQQAPAPQYAAAPQAPQANGAGQALPPWMAQQQAAPVQAGEGEDGPRKRTRKQ
jgi:phage gp37-like protein